MMTKVEFSKYERARIIGARGLQISMDAPLLLKFKEEELESVNYDPLKLAEKELDAGVLPISISRPRPDSREEDLRKIKIDEASSSDEEKVKAEHEEERDIVESGDLNELASSDEEDFVDDAASDGSGSESE